MTQTTPPADLLDHLVRALEPIFRLDDLVALSPERALYRAWDRLLKRPIALRAHLVPDGPGRDRKSTRLNSSHMSISYAVFCLKKKKRRSGSAERTRKPVTHQTTK